MTFSGAFPCGAGHASTSTCSRQDRRFLLANQPSRTPTSVANGVSDLPPHPSDLGVGTRTLPAQSTETGCRDPWFGEEAVMTQHVATNSC